MKVGPIDFVRHWQESGSVVEAAKRCGISVEAACGRAKYFRKRGVGLKYFARGGSRFYDWKALARLAKELARKARG